MAARHDEVKEPPNYEDEAFPNPRLSRWLRLTIANPEAPVFPWTAPFSWYREREGLRQNVRLLYRALARKPITPRSREYAATVASHVSPATLESSSRRFLWSSVISGADRLTLSSLLTPRRDRLSQYGATDQIWNAIVEGMMGNLCNMKCDVALACAPRQWQRLRLPMPRPLPPVPNAAPPLRLPEAAVDVDMNMSVCDQMVLTGKSPCFSFVLDHGVVDPEHEVLSLDARDFESVAADVADTSKCFDRADAGFAAANWGTPYRTAVQLGELNPQHAFTYVIRERAPYTVAEWVKVLRTHPLHLFGFMRSVLLQLSVTLFSAYKTMKFVHGNLTVDTVKLKYLRSFADKSWLFRGDSNWKCVPPEDHMGLLVKICEFGSSSGVVSYRRNGAQMVSVAQSAYDDNGDVNAAVEYDMGCFCWSLARLLDADTYHVILELLQEKNHLTELFKFMEKYTHSKTMEIETKKRVAEVVEYLRQTKPWGNSPTLHDVVERMLSPGGELRSGKPDNLVRNTVFHRSGNPEDDKVRDAVVEWITEHVVPHHAKTTAKAQMVEKDKKGPPKNKRLRRMDNPISMDAHTLFVDYNEIPATDTNLVALSTALHDLIIDMAFRPPTSYCYLCGKLYNQSRDAVKECIIADPREHPTRRTMTVACCSMICYRILSDKLTVVSPMEILLTPSPEFYEPLPSPAAQPWLPFPEPLPLSPPPPSPGASYPPTPDTREHPGVFSATSPSPGASYIPATPGTRRLSRDQSATSPSAEVSRTPETSTDESPAGQQQAAASPPDASYDPVSPRTREMMSDIFAPSPQTDVRYSPEASPYESLTSEAAAPQSPDAAYASFLLRLEDENIPLSAPYEARPSRQQPTAAPPSPPRSRAVTYASAAAPTTVSRGTTTKSPSLPRTSFL